VRQRAIAEGDANASTNAKTKTTANANTNASPFLPRRSPQGQAGAIPGRSGAGGANRDWSQNRTGRAGGRMVLGTLLMWMLLMRLVTLTVTTVVPRSRQVSAPSTPTPRSTK
jgi:hypothetical protein